MNKENLRKFLFDKYGKIDAAAPLISFGPPLVPAYDVIFDVENAGKDDEREIMLYEILERLLEGGITQTDKEEIINEVLNRLPVAEEVSV